jgi:hypothetical protein
VNVDVPSEIEAAPLSGLVEATGEGPVGVEAVGVTSFAHAEASSAAKPTVIRIGQGEEGRRYTSIRKLAGVSVRERRAERVSSCQNGPHQF